MQWRKLQLPSSSHFTYPFHLVTKLTPLTYIFSTAFDLNVPYPSIVLMRLPEKIRRIILPEMLHVPTLATAGIVWKR